MNLTSEYNSPQHTATPLMNNHNNPQSALPQNFTEEEAANWLKISRITLQRLRKAGKVAFYRVGGSRIIYSLKHLEDYLETRERLAYNAC